MVPATFLNLPPEIHVSIAEYCYKKDLMNLCLTSKRVNQVFLCVLYRQVNLYFDRYGLGVEDSSHKRQQQLVHTLLSQPEYGRHVRSLKGKLYIPGCDDSNNLKKDGIQELWRAMQSLTHVQNVDLTSQMLHANRTRVPFPNGLFQFATSVRLVGQMQYGLAKSILKAINPAMLKHLCLDMVQDVKVGNPRGEFVPGERGEDGRPIALGATSGLLKMLTGRCTALKTLILRRVGQVRQGFGWHAAAENISHVEWAYFIRSVQGTVEKLIIEQVGDWVHDYSSTNEPRPIRIMDLRFRRCVFPIIVTAKWPCLTIMEIRGVRSPRGQFGYAALKTVVRANSSENAEIVVEAEAHDYREPYLWNEGSSSQTL